MGYFPISSTIYIFSSATCLIYSFHYWKIWKKTGNEYSRMFWQLGLWVALGEILYGVPALIYPAALETQAFLWFVGSFAIFTGIAWGPLQVSLISWKYFGLAAFAKFAIPASIIILSAINLINKFPSIYMDKYGLIHWNISYPYNLIWFIAGIAETFVPAIFLFMSRTESQKAIVKKTLFSITFLLGGLGGWGTAIFKDTVYLAISFTLFFLGFFALAIMAILDISMKDELNENSRKQVLGG